MPLVFSKACVAIRVAHGAPRGLLDEGGDLGATERLEPHRLGRGLLGERTHRRAEARKARRRGAIGTHHEERGGPDVGRDQREEAQAVEVGEMEVVDDEEERLAFRARSERAHCRLEEREA